MGQSRDKQRHNKLGQAVGNTACHTHTVNGKGTALHKAHEQDTHQRPGEAVEQHGQIGKEQGNDEGPQHAHQRRFHRPEAIEYKEQGTVAESKLHAGQPDIYRDQCFYIAQKHRHCQQQSQFCELSRFFSFSGPGHQSPPPRFRYGSPVCGAGRRCSRRSPRSVPCACSPRQDSLPRI